MSTGADPDTSGRTWTFLTNHAHVLLAIARAPDLRLREIADLVGVTERTTAQIVDDLERDGYLRRERRGRRNHYTVDERLHLRHPLEEHHQISQLLHALEHRPPATLTAGRPAPTLDPLAARRGGVAKESEVIS